MATPAPSASSPVTATSSSSPPSSSSGLYEHVAHQGEVVRKLKSEKAPKVFKCMMNTDSRKIPALFICHIPVTSEIGCQKFGVT